MVAVNSFFTECSVKNNLKRNRVPCHGVIFYKLVPYIITTEQ